MDRVAIKAHIIKKLKEFTDGALHITGDYSENMDTVTVVVSILAEQEMVGRSAGRIGYDYLTDKHKVMYITNLSIGISVYSPIDEESSSICSNMRGILRERGHELINEAVNISAYRGVGDMASPQMVERGERKTWMSRVGVVLAIKEIIETRGWNEGCI